MSQERMRAGSPHIRQAVLSEIERLGHGNVIIGARRLKKVVREQLESPVRENLSPTVARVLSQYESGEMSLITALMAVVESQKPRALAKKPDLAAGRMRRSVNSRVSEATVVKRRGSEAFGYGTGAHEIMRKLVAQEISKFSLIENEGGAIIGVQDQVSPDAPTQASFLTEEEVGESKSEKKKTTKEKKETQEDKPPTRVLFKYPLANDPEFGSIGWARGEIEPRLELLRGTSHDLLPATNYAIEQALKSDTAKKTLTELAEVIHVLFGENGQMAFPIYDAEHKVGQIDLNERDSDRILNMLCLCRTIVNNGKELNHDSAVFPEITVGNIDFQTGDRVIPISGGRLDRLQLTLRADAAGSSPPWWSDLRQVCGYIESKFRSQERTYAYLRPGAVAETDVLHVENYRNVVNLFISLYEIYGDRLFAEIQIENSDWKFMIGDGGWRTRLDTNNLPMESHFQQVSEYIFLILTQLYRAKKWVDMTKPLRHEFQSQMGESGEPTKELRDRLKKLNVQLSVSVEEVVDFAIKTGVINRIHGHIEYQTPETSIAIPVKINIATKEQLIYWGKGIMEKRTRNAEARMASAIALSGISQFIAAATNKVKEIPEERPIVPEELDSICKLDLGTIYLGISEIGKFQITNAIYLIKEGVYILWVTGITGHAKVRIAINAKTGSFHLSWPGGSTSGYVTVDLQANRATTQEPKVLLSFLITALQQQRTDIREFDTANTLDYIVGDTGELIKPVAGKPIVIRINPSTGTYRLVDLVTLTQAAKADPDDKFGMITLFNEAQRGFPRSRKIRCPFPDHENTDRSSPAAKLYNLEKKGQGIFIKCFVCQRHLHIKTPETLRTEVTVLRSAQDINDFMPVSDGREKTLRATFRMARRFLQYEFDLARKFSMGESPVDSSVARYVIEKRGLGPEDLTEAGYFPTEFLILLADIEYSIRKEKLHLKNDRPILDTNWQEELLRVLEPYGPIGKEIAEMITVGYLREARARAILGWSDKQYERKTMGDTIIPTLSRRIVFPMVWLNGKEQLVTSNLNGRLVVPSVLTEPAHYKLPIRSQAKGAKNSTPPGFYVGSNPEVFASKVYGDTVVLLEGPFNLPSVARILPYTRDRMLAICGQAHPSLVPLLRWLGVKTVVIGMDFDLPGRARHKRFVEEIKEGLGDVSVYDLMEALAIELPELRRTLDDRAESTPGKLLIKDMNEVLTRLAISHRYTAQPNKV